MATAEGVSVERAKVNLLNRMRSPCGAAPRKRALSELKVDEGDDGGGGGGISNGTR